MDTTTTPSPLLLRLGEAARMLSVSRRTIYVLVERGDLRLRHIGRASRIHINDLRAYADSPDGDKAVRT
ncbi:MAG: helix-turn-helix domain-containing protein [Planctomycetes bacterium]|nr:helix-turn-helix domain-containing protein [Planctomycetota bacterium]